MLYLKSQFENMKGLEVRDRIIQNCADFSLNTDIYCFFKKDSEKSCKNKKEPAQNKCGQNYTVPYLFENLIEEKKSNDFMPLANQKINNIKIQC